MAKKSKKKIREIRIARPGENIYEIVERLAEKEGRTIAMQANYMISQYIGIKKIK